MPDLAAIGSVLSSLKTATDIAKLLRETDFSLEKAELKLKLAELMSALADAKMEMSSVQDTISERERRIAELEEAFQLRATVVRDRDAYYTVGEDGKPTGQPMCLRCWDIQHKLYRLHFDAKDRFVKVCPACAARYEARMAQNIAAQNVPPAA
ncbi:MAG: hypothetical protein NTW01_13150 [Gammaproteobacteria bacterium]|nr:hypothetical protein [Gammaproteobacteria bacterium]